MSGTHSPSGGQPSTAKPVPPLHLWERLAAHGFGVSVVRDGVVAGMVLGLATLLMYVLRSHFNVLNISLIYLIVVIALALVSDRRVSIGSAVAAFLLFDFVFILPYYTFSVSNPDHALALFVFLAVATITSQLVSRVRRQTLEALERGRRMETLYALAGALISDLTVDAMLATIVGRVVDVLEVADCAILMPDDDGRPVVRAQRGTAPDLNDREQAGMLAWVLEQRLPATLGPPVGRVHMPRGRNAGPRDGRRSARSHTALYVPIASGARVAGVLYVADVAGGRRFTRDDEQLLTAFANHAAVALERVRLTEEATRAAVLERSDELKSALLAAVSHDLRTPLASIKASATGLLQEDISWSPADQRDLLEAIDEETDRLTRIVSNLLDLSRIDAGRLRPALEWNDPEELIRQTAERMQPALNDHPIRVTIAGQLPAVFLDYVEISQVLVNILENAGKYSPDGAPIDLTARAEAAWLVIEVADRGPGVPETDAERIFERFQRLETHRAIPGTGIGLSISRGIVEAHGGTLSVSPRPGGGAVFRVTLPVSGPEGARGA